MSLEDIRDEGETFSLNGIDLGDADHCEAFSAGYSICLAGRLALESEETGECFDLLVSRSIGHILDQFLTINHVHFLVEDDSADRVLYSISGMS